MVKSKASFVVAAAMAGLVAGAASLTGGCKHNDDSGAGMSASGNGTASDASMARHDCKGLNSCKGQGGCKSSDNGCKGKNSCKGKGGCNTN